MLDNHRTMIEQVMGGGVGRVGIIATCLIFVYRYLLHRPACAASVAAGEPIENIAL